MTFPLPRFEAVSRRQFLRTAALGAVVVLPACGADDSRVLGREPLDPSGTSSESGSTPTVPATDAPTTIAAAAAAAVPASAQLLVNFTYFAEGTRVLNPYIAVWVETPEGEMVNTISLWLKREKSRYLDHLKRWYNAEANLLDEGGPNTLDAVSGASRPAGDYQVVWQCTDVFGDRVATGDYVLCVEAAREHGPYELVSGPITLGSEAFTVTLADSGELSAVSAAFEV